MKYELTLEHDPQGECRWVGILRLPDGKTAEASAEDLLYVLYASHQSIAEHIGQTITGKFEVPDE